MRMTNAFARSLAFACAFALSLSSAFAAGGKASTFENALLKLIFNATSITGIADNTASTPATVLCVALHTSDPGVGGSQSTNEATYTSYARVAVNRNSGGWTVTTNSVSPVSIIVFPAATGGSETETYFSIAVPTSGSTCSGALVILYRGPISPSIAVSTGVTPELGTGTVATEN
jgi:hypothetical protein